MPRKKTSRRHTASELARALVAEQLSLVRKRVAKAASASVDDAEAVHKVRVATRRARAALELFQPLLAKKHLAWFLKQLKKLRKAADEARNLDVFAQRMQAQQLPLPESVNALLTRRRAKAQAPLQKLHKQLVANKRWSAKQAKLIASIKPDDQPAREFVRRALEPRITEFTGALAMKDRSAARLHELRIAGKKLRYSLELASPALPKKAVKRVLEKLEATQGTLGDLNDLATAAELVDRLAAQTKKRSARAWLKAQRKRERVAFSEARAKFLRTFDSKARAAWPRHIEKLW